MVGKRGAAKRGSSTNTSIGGPSLRSNSRANSSGEGQFSDNRSDPEVVIQDPFSPITSRMHRSTDNLNLIDSASLPLDGVPDANVPDANVPDANVPSNIPSNNASSQQEQQEVFRLPPIPQGTRELPIPPPVRNPASIPTNNMQNRRVRNIFTNSSSSPFQASSQSEFSQVITMLSRQTQAMSDQFNEQLYHQQQYMDTMRQEFLASQRLIATELSQTRESLHLSNRGQSSRPSLLQHGNIRENFNSNGRSLHRSSPPSNPLLVQQVPLSNNQQSNSSAQPQVGVGSRQGQPSLIPVPIQAPINVASADANNARAMPTFHLKAAEIPHYKGAEESQTPYDFLIDLDKYKAISRSTDEFMINEIAPLALQGKAFHWYRFEASFAPFENYEDFKTRFRREFQPVGYVSELSRELELRTQGPTESLTVFIRVIVDYNKRLGLTPTDAELVMRIKRQMHPEYVQALQGKIIVTMKDLMDAAFEAQDLIKSYRAYRPPSLLPGVEPSLQWHPMDNNFHQARNETQTFTAIPDQANARLHPHAIDAYTFYHTERPAQNNQQQFQPRSGGFFNNSQSDRQRYEVRSNNQNQTSSRPNNDFRSRDPSPNPTTARPVTPTDNVRPSTPTNTNNNNTRRCYTCNAPDHLSPACPLARNSPRASGNLQPPSPARK
jgi:hypothetical protein